MSLKNDRRTIFGWAMYDWANSAYTTTTVAVLFPALLVDEIVPEGGYRLFGFLVDGEQLGSLLGGSILARVDVDEARRSRLAWSFQADDTTVAE